MSNIILDDLKSGYNLNTINVNFDKIEKKINEELVHNIGNNNVLLQDLDFNSNRILNLPAPITDSEPLRKGDITTNTTGATVQYVDGYVDGRIDGELIKHFDTVTEATSDASLVIGDVILISDRGNSYWDVVDKNSVTPNTYNIIESTANANIAFTLRVNEETTVEAFGAKGVGNESNVLQAYLDWAANQSGLTTIRLARGKTYTATDLTITTNTALNLNKSTIKQVPDATTSILHNVSTTDTQTESNIFIFNGTLDGDSSSFSADIQTFLLKIISVKSFGLKDLVFKDLRSINVSGGKSIGLVISGTSSNYFIDTCEFYDMGTPTTFGNGLFAKGSYAVVSNCIADRVYDTAFNFERLTNGTMTNNIAANTGNGFAVTLECENIAISNNISINSSAHNFLVDKFVAAGGTLMRNVVLSNNVAKNAGTGGVGNNYLIKDSDQISLNNNIADTSDDMNFEIQGCTKIVLNGGIAKDSSTKYGVLVQNSTDVKVDGLDISTSFAYGVFCWDSTAVKVTNNKIHNTLQHQIRIKGGSFITVTGNDIYDNDGTAQRALITDTAPDNVIITGNNIFDTRATPVQRGVSIDSTATNVIYGKNNLSNLVVGNWFSDASTNSKGYTKKGATSARPTGLSDTGDDVGTIYLDTTLTTNGKPIFWTGTAWVDGTGVVV